MNERRLEFGWFIPTSGDTVSYGDPQAVIPPSLEMFERVAKAAEAAGFEYLLVPVASNCWDAYISSAFVGGTTNVPGVVARAT